MSNTTRYMKATTFLLLFVLSINCAKAQFEYSYPMNGSRNEVPNQTIILRNGQLMDPNSLSSDLVTLTGSKSGVIPASIVLSTDEKTVCITPAVPFAYDENVSVNVKDGLRTLAGQILSGTSINFSTRREMTEYEKQHLREYLSTHDDGGYLINDPNQQATYVPPPSSDLRNDPLDFIIIYTNNNPAPGKLFFNENSGSAPQTSAEIGYGIMDSNGDSVFYRATNIDGINFHLNLNGMLTAYRLDFGVDTAVIELDASYNVVNVVNCGNGLIASQHEHLFFPDGSKWFTVYDWQPGWNLQPFGGIDGATVNVSRIQKLDANDNVTFEWRSDQHFQVTDACSDISLATQDVDPWHINSLHIEDDGTIIASFRNMNRVVKINDSNGSIVWHWGGIKGLGTPCPNNISDFTTTGDVDGGFSHQHHVHRIENGHILMFDNGNSQPAQFQVSKPKEYSLDETNLTANLVWTYAHPQVNGFPMYTKNQGSAIRLPNGNTIMGYGLPNTQGLPNGTEINANEEIVWEFRFKDSTEYTYRLYKSDNNVGIANVSVSSLLHAFPNPSTGLITLEMDVPTGQKSNIAVINVLGQVVYSKTENLHRGKTRIDLDLSALKKGFYLIQLSSGDTNWAERILLQE